MSTAFECREHGVSVTSVPAYVDDEWVTAAADQHSRQHAAEAKWRVFRDAEGWWIAKRGEHQAACFTWQQAHLHRVTVTLVELAADEWELHTAPGQITVQQHGDPLTRVFRDQAGTPAVAQALTFLVATLAERARRRTLADARDRAAAELDVLTDQMNRDAAAIAREQLV